MVNEEVAVGGVISRVSPLISDQNTLKSIIRTLVEYGFTTDPDHKQYAINKCVAELLGEHEYTIFRSIYPNWDAGIENKPNT